MRSEAVLLVLLAAPCVVESAAAFPPAVVKVNAVLKAMQEIKPLTAPNKKGLLSASDIGSDVSDKKRMECSADFNKLAMNQAWWDDYTACTGVCLVSNGEGVRANALAGTDTTSCAAAPACTKFKKTCAAEAGWGFWVDETTEITIKDFRRPQHIPGGIYKDSTHTLAYMTCVPSSCEGTSMTTMHGDPLGVSLRLLSFSSEYDTVDTADAKPKTFTVEKGTTTKKSDASPNFAGLTATETITIEQMPPPMWFYIVIVVVVLSIALTVYLIKTGRCRCCDPYYGRCGSAAATTPHPTQAQRKEEKDEEASTPKEYKDAPADFEED